MSSSYLLLALLAGVALAQESVNEVRPEGCAVTLDVAFVVDSSGSIQEADPDGWTKVKRFVQQVTRFFPEATNTQFAATVYSEFATQDIRDSRIADGAVGFFPLDAFDNRQDLENAIDRLIYFNSLTNTQDGLRVASEVIFVPPADRAGITNLAFVITDGISNVQPERVEEEANRLKEKAIVIAVGVLGANLAELQTIASNPNLVLQVTDFNALEAELERILALTCDVVAPTTPTGRCCDFDGDFGASFCDFEMGGTAKFTGGKGETPSTCTGPHMADTGLYYAYLEASNLDPEDQAELSWTNIGLNNTCLDLAYHMHGHGVGMLAVEVRESRNEEWHQIWNATGDCGDHWMYIHVDINEVVGDLRIVAVRGSDWQGDIAIDSIKLGEGPCFPMPEMEENGDNETCVPPEANGEDKPPKPTFFLPYPAPPPPRRRMNGDDDEEEMEEGCHDLGAEECAVYEHHPIVLVGGSNASYGRVEVYYNGTFGAICNSTFTDREARAVCFDAGFYGGRVMTEVPREMRLAADDREPIFLDNVRCKEGQHIDECCHSEWGSTDCDHDSDVFVECDLIPPYCNQEGDHEGHDMSLCDRNMLETPFSLVLVDGAHPNEGRLEIYANGQFGTVCNHSFGVLEAMAVCKSLGFYAGNIWLDPPSDMRLSNEADRPILLSGVHCEEGSRLQECCYNKLGYDDGCSHDEDIFVRCYDRPEPCINYEGCQGASREAAMEMMEEAAEDAEEEMMPCEPNDMVCMLSRMQGANIVPLPVSPFNNLLQVPGMGHGMGPGMGQMPPMMGMMGGHGMGGDGMIGGRGGRRGGRGMRGGNGDYEDDDH